MRNVQGIYTGLIILFISTLSCLSCSPNKDVLPLSAPILTSPSEGATFATGDSVSFAADVSEIGNTIAIEFWVENGDSASLVFTDEHPPYAYSTKLQAGVYTVWAACIFSTGEEINSDVISITIEEPRPETFIHITSPTDGSIFLFFRQ